MNRSTDIRYSVCGLLVVGVFLNSAVGDLTSELLKEPAANLANAAVELGDSKRGAVLFYQQRTTCLQCHQDPAEDPKPREVRSGPDLADWIAAPTGIDLVNSILKPSERIRPGFETYSAITADGKVTSGLLVAKQPKVVLRDLLHPKKQHSFHPGTLEELTQSKKSAMPENLANLLNSRQQFLDLIAYLIKLSEEERPAARRLKPAAHLYASAPVPEYEANIDHAGMIQSFSAPNLKSGAAIYRRLCANCHGTLTSTGSLPTALNFATGNFRNGSDPYSMYQTLTHGYGMMQAQAWMVPTQKYDVIHYIRETYLKTENPGQYFEMTDDWLASLPKGKLKGPAASNAEPWVAMNYGSTLINTYEVGESGQNFSQKGIAMRLDSGPGGISRGRSWMIFDHDTMRMSAAYSGNQFIDWKGIHFNGQHGIHPRIRSNSVIQNLTGPGWANPETGSWEDQRTEGRDGRQYGPLPRQWAQYKGLYRHGDNTVISYRIGDADILESPSLEHEGSQPVYVRHLKIGPRRHDLNLQIAQLPDKSASGVQLNQHSVFLTVKNQSDRGSGTPIKDVKSAAGHENVASGIAAGIHSSANTNVSVTDNRIVATIPASSKETTLSVWMTLCETETSASEIATVQAATIRPAIDFDTLTKGSTPRFPEKITTEIRPGDSSLAFQADVMTRPATNPWNARIRLAGFDFIDDGKSAIVAAWDGDVWQVDGIDQVEGKLTWSRIASGLFQPLGVKVVDGRIYVTCRDQLVILNDTNDDGYTDFYECFNSDHQVTEHFHEFAMGLQTDAVGNFYYAKSARHAKKAVVPHHGTLLKVSPDGESTEIIAAGFRAANGVCVNPDGSFVVTDQEGHWNPKNRINWVRPGGFYGNMFGYHDVTDSSDEAMQQPLCWITNSFDRSPAELLWVPKETWGNLAGSLLNLSYGYGQIHVVPHEEIDGQMQGGMCALPIPQFPTGLVRGRFDSASQSLFACGMFAWAGNQKQPGGFYRIRRTETPAWLPTSLNVKDNTISIHLTDSVESASAQNVENYVITTWDLKRTANYGSKHFNEQQLQVTKAVCSDDGTTIELTLPNLKPTWGMEIRCRWKSAGGEPIERTIHNTIHKQ